MSRATDGGRAGWSMPLRGGGSAEIVVTDRSDGDFGSSAEPADLGRRRAAIVAAPWSWCRQVHGSVLHVVAAAGAVSGLDGDALCTRVPASPISVTVADCAPVALVDAGGSVAVIHAGWRGLLDGVIEAGVSAMRSLGAQAPVALLGPCIWPAHYAFGERELALIADRYGDTVRGRTLSGAPALDLPAAVGVALDGLGVDIVARIGGCTAAEADLRWSHRARGDTERQVMVAWIDDGDAP